MLRTNFSIQPDPARIDRTRRRAAWMEISDTTAVEFGVGYQAGPGSLHERLVIPLEDDAGRLVAIVGVLRWRISDQASSWPSLWAFSSSTGRNCCFISATEIRAACAPVLSPATVRS